MMLRGPENDEPREADRLAGLESATDLSQVAALWANTIARAGVGTASVAQ